MVSTEHVKGALAAVDAGGRLSFQHNPESIEDRTVARWANIAIAGVHHPRLQYVSGEGRTISFTLKLYHSHNGQTPGQALSWLRSLCYPDLGGGIPTRPPTRVMLHLGPDYAGVLGVMTEVVGNSSMFDRELNITYLEASLTLVEFAIKAVGFSEVRR